MSTLKEVVADFVGYLPTDLAIHFLRDLGVRPELTGYHPEIDSQIKQLLEQAFKSIGHIVNLESLGYYMPGHDRKYPYLYRFQHIDTDQDWLRDHYPTVIPKLAKTFLTLGFELYVLQNQPDFIFVRLTPTYSEQTVSKSEELLKSQVV